MIQEEAGVKAERSKTGSSFSNANEGKRTSHYTKEAGLLFQESVKKLYFFVWVTEKSPQSWECPFKQVIESQVTGLYCMIQEAETTITEKMTHYRFERRASVFLS